MNALRKGYNLLFRIGSDFVSQILNNIESQNELAKRLKRSKGAVSQILNNPGNLELTTMIKYAGAINMKIGIVLYDKNNNDRPIHPDIFRICWEKLGSPRDFVALKLMEPTEVRSNLEDMTVASTVTK